MTVTEKVSYAKGLLDGLSFDPTSKKDKMFKAMLDILEDLALTVTDLEDETAALGDEMEELYEELEFIEDDLYGDDEEDDCECGCQHGDIDFIDEEDDEEDDELELDSGEELYQVVCPTCSEIIYLDEAMIEAGHMKCPACGEDLEFDLTELEAEIANLPEDDE